MNRHHLLVYVELLFDECWDLIALFDVVVALYQSADFSSRSQIELVVLHVEHQQLAILFQVLAESSSAFFLDFVLLQVEFPQRVV